MNRPASLLAAVVISLIAALQLLRIILGIKVTVNGYDIPIWLSVIAVIFMGALAAGLWNERRW